MPVLPRSIPASPVSEMFEIVPEGEFREIFNIAAVGIANIHTNWSRYREEIIEIVVESVGANTVQFTIEDRPITPAFAMVANQVYIDPGFLLEPRQTIRLVTGAALQVLGYVHGRLRDAP